MMATDFPYKATLFIIICVLLISLYCQQVSVYVHLMRELQRSNTSAQWNAKTFCVNVHLEGSLAVKLKILLLLIKLCVCHLNSFI